MKYCSDLAQLLSPDDRVSASCCASCHDDCDMGYGDMCNKEINGEEYYICCSMLHEWEADHGQD